MKIDLPYPHKHLWPNGPRGNIHAVSREKKKHREWATWAVKASGDRPVIEEGKAVPIKLTVHAMPKGPLPDRDNCSAAAKLYLDGIAAALGVNDRSFGSPIVEFAETRTARFVIEVGDTFPFRAHRTLADAEGELGAAE